MRRLSAPVIRKFDPVTRTKEFRVTEAIPAGSSIVVSHVRGTLRVHFIVADDETDCLAAELNSLGVTSLDEYSGGADGYML